MYIFKDQLEEEEVRALDSLYREAEFVSVFQHPEWSDPLQSNQRKRFFLQKENEGIVLSAKITESHLTKAPFVKYAHLKGGFICKDLALLVPAIKEIHNHYTSQQFAKLTVELFGDLQGAEFVERTLLKEGFHFGHDLVAGARATVMLPLADDIEKIHAGFSTHLKRNIAKAQKKNITVKEINSPGDFEPFLNINHKMEQARSLSQASEGFLKDLFRFIQKTGQGHFLASYDETDKMIGGIFLLKEGRNMLYLIGATDPDYKNLPQSHLTFYEAIKIAKSDGIDFFDFGGFGFDAPKGSQVFNINEFKLNFSKQITFYPKSIIFKTNSRIAFIGDTFLKLKSLVG